MKYIIYHATSPNGYEVDIMTDGKKGGPTYQELAQEEHRIMVMEKAGWVVKKAVDVQPAPEKPLEATTPPYEKFCETHKVEMKERQGKYGVFYSHAQKVGEEWVYCTGKGWGVK